MLEISIVLVSLITLPNEAMGCTNMCDGSSLPIVSSLGLGASYYGWMTMGINATQPATQPATNQTTEELPAGMDCLQLAKTKEKEFVAGMSPETFKALLEGRDWLIRVKCLEATNEDADKVGDKPAKMFKVLKKDGTYEMENGKEFKVKLPSEAAAGGASGNAAAAPAANTTAPAPAPATANP